MTKMIKISVVATLVVSLSLASVVAFAQDSNPPATDEALAQAPAAANFNQAQLDQMVAPVALYPDSLLGQILMASTYPLEVVEAARWLQDQGNAALTGDNLTAALDQQTWDPSVKALVPFPQVVAMMNTNLQWTEQLGDAFLAQQDAVMDSVQHLRQQAQAAGSLKSSPQEAVSTQGSDILIQPQNPDVVYVPSYDPATVYGAWDYPSYPPYNFYGSGYAWGPGFIGFGAGIVIGNALWGWDRWDWGHHRIEIDDRRYTALNRGRPPVTAGVWRHDPAHRVGVPYRDQATRARYQAPRSAAAQRSARGYAPAASAMPLFNANAARPMQNNVRADGRAIQPASAYRPSSATSARPMATPPAAPQTRSSQTIQMERAPMQQVRSPAVQTSRPAIPIFESFSPGSQVRAQATRGAASRASAPVPQHVSAPQQSAAPQGASRGGGGGNRGPGGNERR